MEPIKEPYVEGTVLSFDVYGDEFIGKFKRFDRFRDMYIVEILSDPTGGLEPGEEAEYHSTFLKKT